MTQIQNASVGMADLYANRAEDRETERQRLNIELKSLAEQRFYGGLAEAAGTGVGYATQKAGESEKGKRQRYLQAAPQEQVQSDIASAGPDGLGEPAASISQPGIGNYFGELYDKMSGFKLRPGMGGR